MWTRPISNSAALVSSTLHRLSAPMRSTCEDIYRERSAAVSRQVERRRSSSLASVLPLPAALMSPLATSISFGNVAKMTPQPLFPQVTSFCDIWRSTYCFWIKLDSYFPNRAELAVGHFYFPDPIRPISSLTKPDPVDNKV